MRAGISCEQREGADVCATQTTSWPPFRCLGPCRVVVGSSDWAATFSLLDQQWPDFSATVAPCASKLPCWMAVAVIFFFLPGVGLGRIGRGGNGEPREGRAADTE